MKIYTKTGDGGETGLFGGARVSKAAAKVAAYGDLDELNAALGVCRATALPPEIDETLGAVQADLFTLGAELATVTGKAESLGIALLGDDAVARLEAAIDASEAALPPLKTFVLPGGTAGAASLHLARTVCRRAERALVALALEESVNDAPRQYLNRLSDLLFVLGRVLNRAGGRGDVLWQKRKNA